MSAPSDDDYPPDVRWHPTRHYDAAMMALGIKDDSAAIAHALLGLLAIEMNR